MSAKDFRRVAALGARFGELEIEKELLSPLGVDTVDLAEATRHGIEVIRILRGKAPKNLVN